MRKYFKKKISSKSMAFFLVLTLVFAMLPVRVMAESNETLADVLLADFNDTFDMSTIEYEVFSSYASPTFEITETGADQDTALRVNWASTDTLPSYVHRFRSSEMGSVMAEHADNYAYLRIWVNNPTFIPINLTTRLFSNTAKVYMNADDAIVSRKDGTVISYSTGNAGAYGTNSSIQIPASFSGWVAYPIDLSAITPSSGRTQNLSSFAEVTKIEMDIRRPETYDKDTYYILDDFCLSMTSVGTIQEENDNDFGDIAGTPIETGLKNVIVLVGDGMGQTTLEAARDYKGTALNMDSMQYSSKTIVTNNALDQLTDSSAAGTALSCGVRTYNGYTALDVEEKAVENMVEFFKRAGKETGIVTTSYLLDATPTAFGSHGIRNNYATLAEGLFKNSISVLLGGGTDYFKTNVSYGGQNYSLLEYAQSVHSYTYVKNAQELQNYDGEKVLGVFGNNYMAYEKDRDSSQMSIADMTKKAISLLENEDEGFFLMVEGGNIDHAEHANDLNRTVTDTLAFDEAVKVALDYLEENPDTLVVVCADHSTGGLAATETGYRFTTNNHDMSLTACYASGLGAEYFTNLTESAHISQAIRKATMETVPHVCELTDVEGRVATCTDDGVVAHQYCESCGRYYIEGELVSEADTVINALGHAYGDWKTDGKNHWKVCECGETVTEAHKWVWIIDKKETAETEGQKHEECSVCGYKNGAVKIPATGAEREKAPQTGDLAINNIMLAIVAIVLTDAAAILVRRKRRSA